MRIKMQKVSQLIQAFGGIVQMSRELGVPVSTIQGWEKAKKVPSWRIDHLRNAATSRGIKLDDYLITAGE